MIIDRGHRPLREKELEFAEDCAKLSNFFAEDLEKDEFDVICSRYWARVNHVKREEDIIDIAARLRREIPKSSVLTPRQKTLRINKAEELAAEDWDRKQAAFLDSVDMARKLNAIGDFMRKEILPRCAVGDDAAPYGFMVETVEGDKVAKVFEKDAAGGRFVYLSDSRRDPHGSPRAALLPMMPFLFIDARGPDAEGYVGPSLYSEEPALAVAHLFAASRYWPFRICRWEACQTGSKGADTPTLFVPADYGESQSCSGKCRDAFLHWARSNPEREEYDPKYVEKRREAAARQRERKRLANVSAGKSRKRRKKKTNQGTKRQKEKPNEDL